MFWNRRKKNIFKYSRETKINSEKRDFYNNEQYKLTVKLLFVIKYKMLGKTL